MRGKANLDDVAALIESTPFDTLSTVLRRRAGDRPADAPYLLSVAAWCSVIRDELDDATELAALADKALDDQHHDELSRIIVDSLATMIGAFEGTGPIDHALLDRLASALDEASAGAGCPVLEVLEPALEVANWFTFADRYEDASRIIDRRLDALGPGDTIGHLATLCCLAELDWRRGRWSTLTSRMGKAIDAAEAQGHGTAYAHALIARVLGAEGRWEECAEHLAASRRSSQQRGDLSTGWRIAAIEGFIDLCRDDAAGALRSLAPLVERAQAVGPHLAAVRLWDGDLIEAQVRTGNRDAAQASVARLEAEVARVPSRFSLGVIIRSKALLAIDPLEAVALATVAAAEFESVGAVFEQARAELIRGQALDRAGADDEAAHSRRRARQMFDALGTPAWAARTECGPGLVSTRGGDSEQGRWLQVLTPVERTVVATLLRGGSNRAIAAELHMSVKTVEGHLTRAYRKLGCGSRAQLIARFLTS